MKIAVTNHAVQRFQERVEGVSSFDDESIRKIIRTLVELGFEEEVVRPHPRHFDRRIIPFSSGPSILYLSLGPNLTTFEGEFSVIGVLFERELSDGKVGLDVTVGDTNPILATIAPAQRVSRFVVTVGAGKSIERYDIGGVRELKKFLERRVAGPVNVYRLLEDKELRGLLGE